MGNCNFKDKKSGGNSEGIWHLLNEEKISKNLFNYLYVIGKGGFGRVICIKYKGLESRKKKLKRNLCNERNV